MSVLVTGGTGFVGAHLTRLLVTDKGEEVVVFDRFPNRERVADIIDRFTLIEGDILEPQELMWAMEQHGVQKVIHLAGVFGPPRADRALQFARLGCVGTANVFETARLHGVKRLVNASSVAVFGQGVDENRSETEEDCTVPSDVYGACKLWSEHFADFYNRRHDLAILSLRICPSLGYGRLDRSSFRAGITSDRRSFMAAPEIVARGKTVTVPPGDELADFLYVVDTAEALWLALTAPLPAHAVFNLRAEQRPVGDFTRILGELMPDARIEVAATSRRSPIMDNSRVVTELGFAPRYTLEQGLAEYVEVVRRACD